MNFNVSIYIINVNKIINYLILPSFNKNYSLQLHHLNFMQIISIYIIKFQNLVSLL